MAAKKTRAPLPRKILKVHLSAGIGFTCLVVETIDGRLVQFDFRDGGSWRLFPPIPSGELPSAV